MITKIKCILCKCKLDYERLDSDIGDTHIWICPECPFIGFEFYGGYDLKALKNRLQ
jgi:hypothetical protein